MASIHPQTPRSPSQSSPGTGADTHPSVNSSMSSMSTLPTPAHSVNGSSMSIDMTANDQSITMGGMDESPQKRKRPLDDMGDREQKKVHIEDSRLGIEALHQDVGPKYKICQPRPAPRFPSVNIDLIEEYGLNDLQTAVARILPSGEKNAMRKSYKGALKKLKIQGDFEPVTRDWKEDTDHFSRFLSADEDTWQGLFVRGKDIRHGLSEEVANKLTRATMLVRGPMPPNVWDGKVLGVLASDKINGNKAAQSALKAGISRTTPGTPVHPAKPQQPIGAREARPSRGHSKRKYDDSSFDGYRESFDEDTGMDTGYSTAEGEGGQKRRKKNTGPSQFSGPLRQGNYGPGMVNA